MVALPPVYSSMNNQQAASLAPLVSNNSNSLRSYIGSSTWLSGDLIGKAYPRGTSSATYLHHYSRLYNTCQTDLTFYKNFSAAAIGEWVSQIASPDFRFCPVLFNKLTSKLNSITPIGESAFFNSVHAFGRHLGPLIIQMPDGLPASRLAQLHQFLHKLPAIGNYFYRYTASLLVPG